ncbi:hypothetical protein BGZ98_009071 [Dissophora globulifera]|nr:hypothetical protein BGZ98_009071 [Dissophora globulifera]
MSLDNTEPPAIDDIPHTNAVATRPRKQSAENNSLAWQRRKAVAVDGLMFESGSNLDESSPESPHKKADLECIATLGQDEAHHIVLEAGSLPSVDSTASKETTISRDEAVNETDSVGNDPIQTTPRAPLSSTSSSSSTTSTTTTPNTPPELLNGHKESSSVPHEQDDEAGLAVNTLPADLAPLPINRSGSFSKRQSMFLGDHITISQEGPVIEAPSSNSPGSNGDQEDIKEVQIETTDPSHLFWVPFHLHPEIAPNEYNRWLTKHGVENEAADGVISSRNSSITRRKSVLSAQYNPEDDHEDQSGRLPKVDEIGETRDRDFLSAVLSAPLEETEESPLTTKTSLRRKDHFPVDIIEEDLMNAKRPGAALERGGSSFLRRSARTKIRRNSTASNEARNDVSRLRPILNAYGEYPAVSLVDLGPQPLPLSTQSPAVDLVPSDDAAKSRKEGESQPVRRFVSTLRDSSKPTITTYVEPHLLEQQRKEFEETNRETNNDAGKEDDEAPSFRVSAPAKLENSAAVRLLVETIENDRKERPDNFTISYPIPPPVKLTQNLLQQSSSQSPSASQPASTRKNSAPSSSQGSQTHAKKPSGWSWLWGKEKGADKTTDITAQAAGPPPITARPGVRTSSAQITTIETHTQSPSTTETGVKKQSTLSMLFSRNGKSTSSKAQATIAESTQSAITHGMSGQSVSSEKPKYSNYSRLPIHIERAIYRLSHVKLANPRRPLHEQVLISNMMFWYLGVIQQQQQQLQQQQEMQQQLLQAQRGNGKGSESSDDGKEYKPKSKPKKKKSQKKKKKNQQNGPSASAERIVKGPDYERQQQQHQQQHLQQQQQHHKRQVGANQGALAHRQDSNPASGNQAWTHNNQYGGGDEENRIGRDAQGHSDSYDESESDEPLQHQQKMKIGSKSDTLTTLSITSPPRTTGASRENEEDDDVPLAHYQNIPRQTVPVS